MNKESVNKDGLSAANSVFPSPCLMLGSDQVLWEALAYG